MFLPNVLSQRFREDRFFIRNEAFQRKGQAVPVPQDKDTARHPVPDGQVEFRRVAFRQMDPVLYYKKNSSPSPLFMLALLHHIQAVIGMFC